MVVNLVLLDLFWRRECLIAHVAFVGEVVAVVHMLPSCILRVEPTAATVALEFRGRMAGREAMVFAGSVTGWELFAARPALEVPVHGHVAGGE